MKNPKELNEYCNMIRAQFTDEEIETSFTFITNKVRGDRTINQMVKSMAEINSNSLPEW